MKMIIVIRYGQGRNVFATTLNSQFLEFWHPLWLYGRPRDQKTTEKLLTQHEDTKQKRTKQVTTTCILVFLNFIVLRRVNVDSWPQNFFRIFFVFAVSLGSLKTEKTEELVDSQAMSKFVASPWSSPDSKH